MSSNSRWLFAFLFIAISSFQACAVVGGIFKAGVWVGVAGIVLIVLLIIFIISKVSGRK
jgi:hypothetical protein